MRPGGGGYAPQKTGRNVRLQRRAPKINPVRRQPWAVGGHGKWREIMQMQDEEQSVSIDHTALYETLQSDEKDPPPMEASWAYLEPPASMFGLRVPSDTHSYTRAPRRPSRPAASPPP